MSKLCVLICKKIFVFFISNVLLTLMAAVFDLAKYQSIVFEVFACIQLLDVGVAFHYVALQKNTLGRSGLKSSDIVSI